jgi:hypothetical protein
MQLFLKLLYQLLQLPQLLQQLLMPIKRTAFATMYVMKMMVALWLSVLTKYAATIDGFTLNV